MAVRPRESAPAWIHRKRCLYCGEDGRAIQAACRTAVFRCPRCMGDLYARPPRSYAELEGLAPERTPSELRPADAAQVRRRRGPLGALIGLMRSAVACVRWILAVRRGDAEEAVGLPKPAIRRPVRRR